MFSKIPTKLSVKKISRASSCYVQSLSTIPTPPRDRTAAAAFASQTRIVYKKVNTTKKHDNEGEDTKEIFSTPQRGKVACNEMEAFLFQPVTSEVLYINHWPPSSECPLCWTRK